MCRCSSSGGMTKDHLNCLLPGEVIRYHKPAGCMCVKAPSSLPLAKGTWGQPCYPLRTLFWDWTSDWLTMVLQRLCQLAKQPVFAVCPSGSISGHFWLLTDNGASSKGLIGLRFLSAPLFQEAWSNQLQPLKYTLTQIFPLPCLQMCGKITIVTETA